MVGQDMWEACSWAQSMFNYLLLVVEMDESDIALRVHIYYDKKIKTLNVLEIDDILRAWFSFLDLDLNELLFHVGVFLMNGNASWIMNHDRILAGLIGLEFEITLILVTNKHIGDEWVLLSNATEVLIDLNTYLSVVLEFKETIKGNSTDFCWTL